MSVGIHVGRELIEWLGQKTYGGALEVLLERYASRCMQIFIMNPQSAQLVNLDGETLASGTPSARRVYAHANYLSHMCKPSTRGIIHAQISRATSLQLAGLIIHLENAPLETNVVAATELLTYAASTAHVQRLKPIKLIFEINALKPADAIFSKPEECRRFVMDVHKMGFGKRDFGICIDTAHLWSCGVSVRFSSEVREWFQAFGDPAWIALFHLNDSKSELGGPDEHDVIGHGRIWPIAHDEAPSGGREHHGANYEGLPRHPRVKYANEAGFIEVLRYAHAHKIDVMLERSKANPEMALAELEDLVKLYRRLG
jgi:endonuclease IV